MYLRIQMSCQWGALFCVWPRTETFKGSPITSKDQIQCPQHTQPTSLIHLLASFLAYLFPLSTALDILNYTLFSKHTIFKICSHIPLIRQFLQLNLVTPFKQTEWQKRWCVTSMCWETQVSCHIIEEPNLPPTSHVRAPPWQWSTQPSSAFKGYIYNLPIRLYLNACSTETREKVPFLL